MIAESYRDEMARLMETVIGEGGPRESCGEAESPLGETLRLTARAERLAARRGWRLRRSSGYPIGG
jgi:hypothetical protein